MSEPRAISGTYSDLKFIKTQASFAGYQSMFNNNAVTSLTVNSGYITGYDGASVPINRRAGFRKVQQRRERRASAERRGHAQSGVV